MRFCLSRCASSLHSGTVCLAEMLISLHVSESVLVSSRSDIPLAGKERPEYTVHNKSSFNALAYTDSELSAV